MAPIFPDVNSISDPQTIMQCASKQSTFVDRGFLRRGRQWNIQIFSPCKTSMSISWDTHLSGNELNAFQPTDSLPYPRDPGTVMSLPPPAPILSTQSPSHNAQQFAPTLLQSTNGMAPIFPDVHQRVNSISAMPTELADQDELMPLSLSSKVPQAFDC